MRRGNLDGYIWVIAPSAWSRLEQVSAATLHRIEEAMDVLADELTKGGPALASSRRDGTLRVDDQIAIYQVDTRKKRISLTAVIQTPTLLSP
jgi:hypothetical protein